MEAKWQKNQSGTHYSDFMGYRIAVRRTAPRERKFKAVMEGKYIGIFPDMQSAQTAAEVAVIQSPKKWGI